MYTIQHNPAGLYNCDKTGITIVQHKHTKMLRVERQASDVFCSIRRSGISCDSRYLFESNWTLIPPLLVFPRKCMKQELMNGTPPRPIHACRFWGWIQSYVFTQWFLHFITYKADKIISLYLSTGRALFTQRA